MAHTKKDALNDANVTTLPTLFRESAIGSIIAGLIPSEITRTGLTSGTTHVHNSRGLIVSVASGTTAQTIVTSNVTLASNQVKITYDANGLPTLVFNAATTAYTVVELALPEGLGDYLGKDSNTNNSATPT